jgi:hypothetical protein
VVCVASLIAVVAFFEGIGFQICNKGGFWHLFPMKRVATTTPPFFARVVAGFSRVVAALAEVIASRIPGRKTLETTK